MGEAAAAAAAAAPPFSRPPHPSLYVGDLHPDVTEVDLCNAFSHYGTVLSVRLCRDRTTKASLRYGYVNLNSFSEAEMALKALNHSLLLSMPIRIMWSNRNPLARKTGVGNLFVKNLEKRIGAMELENLFIQYGTVVSCKVAVDANGRGKGFGFVQMASEEAAHSAITALNGIVQLNTRKKLYVSKFVKKSQRPTRSEGPKRTNLYIKNLDCRITDNMLLEKFSQYGSVSNAVVMKYNDGKSRRFGFVNFKSPEEAKKALEILNGSKFRSRIIYVGYAQKRNERDEFLRHIYKEKYENQRIRPTGSTIFVKFLEKSVDGAALRTLFSDCGEILWTKVAYSGNRVSRGIGFVRFSSAVEANMAIYKYNGFVYKGRRLLVTIAWNKEEFQTNLQSQFAYPEFPPMQYAMPNVPPLYHAPDHELIQNPIRTNSYYHYQQHEMLPFLGNLSTLSSHQH